MTEEYEYERVEIKPGDQSWQGQKIFYAENKTMLLVLFVGEQNIFYETIRDGRVCEDSISIDLPFKNHEFYIRKSKRKTKRIAKALCKDDSGYFDTSALITEGEARELVGKKFFKWPYGEIIEVPEGE